MQRKKIQEQQETCELHSLTMNYMHCTPSLQRNYYMLNVNAAQAMQEYKRQSAYSYVF